MVRSNIQGINNLCLNSQFSSKEDGGRGRSNKHGAVRKNGALSCVLLRQNRGKATAVHPLCLWDVSLLPAAETASNSCCEHSQADSLQHLAGCHWPHLPGTAAILICLHQIQNPFASMYISHRMVSAICFTLPSWPPKII